uniref:Uncharacterized protein n=1 Tax=Glossina pallidipes TaxID=7398 RepID=A0A1A9ZPR7_GLOPL
MLFDKYPVRMDMYFRQRNNICMIYCTWGEAIVTLALTSYANGLHCIVTSKFSKSKPFTYYKIDDELYMPYTKGLRMKMPAHMPNKERTYDIRRDMRNNSDNVDDDDNDNSFMFILMVMMVRRVDFIVCDPFIKWFRVPLSLTN